MQSDCKPYTQDNHWSSNKNWKRLAQKICQKQIILRTRKYSAQSKQNKPISGHIHSTKK